MKMLILAATAGLLAIAPANAQQQPAQQHKTATTTDGKIVYISKAPGDASSISTYYNRNVYNRAGEKLGDINDLLLGPDGKISTAVIGVGGFLGIGEKQVAVPFENVKVEQKDNTWRVVMDATKETLTAAPAFEAAGNVGTTSTSTSSPTSSGTTTTAPRSPTPPSTTSPAPATAPKQ